MSIKIQCPKCGERIGINARLAGRTTACPHCDATLAVPSADQIEAAQRRKSQRRAKADSGGENTAAGIAAASAAAAPTPPPAEEDHGFEPLPIGNKAGRPETEMDMTPMVDVTFLLLIFFMVTASFSLQKALELPPQQSDAPSPITQEEEDEPMEMVTVQVDEYGGYFVLAADWEREVVGKPSLVATLRDAKAGLSGEVRLAIECHEKAVLEALVDAMDAGALNEYAEFQINQVDGF